MRLSQELLAITQRQAGVISRAQAQGLGVSPSQLRTLVDSGRWQRPLRGVFVAHNGPLDYLTRVWAAVTYAGSGAAASHETAAYLARMIDTAPASVHIAVPTSRRVLLRRDDIAIHHVADDAFRREIGRRPPMTPPLHTLLDLIDHAATADDVVALITSACQRRLASSGAIRAAASARARLRWRSLVESVCEEARAGVESALERRYLRDVERAHGLPRAVRQAVLRLDGVAYRHDVDYDEYGLIVELDGLAYHDGPRAAADVARDNALLAAGLIILRYRWRDIVGSPCKVAAQVAAILGSRGWRGSLQPCHRCANAAA